MYQRRRADAGSAERFELSLWRGAYATRMVRLYSSFLCLGSEGGCNHQGSRVQLSLRALHLKSLCPLLVLCLAGRGRQRSCATDSIEACPLGWEPEVVRETRGGTERTMGVSLPNVRIAALCLLIWRGRFPTSRAVAVTLRGGRGSQQLVPQGVEGLGRVAVTLRGDRGPQLGGRGLGGWVLPVAVALWGDRGSQPGVPARLGYRDRVPVAL